MNCYFKFGISTEENFKEYRELVLNVFLAFTNYDISAFPGSSKTDLQGALI